MNPNKPQTAPWNPVQRAGIWFLCAYLVAMFGRLPEFVYYLVNSGLLLVPITLVGSVVTYVLSGGIRRSLASIPGVLITLFTLWLMVCTPFSAWPGGSFAQLRDFWSLSFLAFLCTAGLAVTLKDCRRAMYAIGIGGAAILVMTFWLGRFNDGRFDMGWGSLANANDLATFILVCSPFLLLIGLDRSRFSPVRFAVGTLLIYAIVTVLRTGSRSGLLTLAIILLFTFWQASLATKIKLLPLVVVGVVALYVTAPAALINRYATILQVVPGGDTREFQDESAIESSEGRKEMLRQSLKLTFEHPILGVGPGAFIYATAAEYESKGQRSPWLQSHNAYTQVSSESGLPGFLLFVGTLFYCFFKIIALYRRSRRNPELAPAMPLAFCLLLSLFSFLVNCAFSSIAYQFHWPVLAGLTVVLLRATEKELLSKKDSPQPVSAKPASPHFIVSPRLPSFQPMPQPAPRR